MNKRSSDLLNEMLGIFGESFGGIAEDEFDEARRAMHGGRPLPKGDRGGGRVSGKKQRAKEARRGKKGKKPGGLLGKGENPAITKKRGEEQYKAARKQIAKEVGKHGEKIKKREGEKRFKDAMDSIHKDMTKSEKASKSKSDAASAGGEGSRPEKKQSGRSLAKKTPQRHFPFKRSSDLGPGPRGSKHRETKCWKCKCGNVYRDGCHCVASGSGENCPKKGTVKKISYKPSYKQAYNREYHAWRAKQGARATQKLGATRTAL